MSNKYTILGKLIFTVRDMGCKLRSEVKVELAFFSSRKWAVFSWRWAVGWGQFPRSSHSFVGANCIRPYKMATETTTEQ